MLELGNCVVDLVLNSAIYMNIYLYIYIFYVKDDFVYECIPNIHTQMADLISLPVSVDVEFNRVLG